MKWAKIILLYSAGLILFLHTAIPHSHEGDILASDKASIESSYSLIDLIKNFFSVDIGEGHMENFHSMDGMSHIDLDQSTIPSLDFNFISIDRFYLDVPFPKSTTLALDDLPPPELYRDTYALRGPPLSFFG